MKRLKFSGRLLVSLLIFLVGAFAIYNLPPVQDRVGWRVAELMARFKYALSPPQEVVFVPQQAAKLSTKTIPATSPTSNPVLNNAITSTPSATPSALSTPTKTLTPIPESIKLTGFKHEYQTWNNCGPATLGMALSFWGWQGDQRPIAAFTKPNPRDKNVMPYELTAFVEEKTSLSALSRVGGDIELIKRLIASGFPVIIEKGFEGPDFEGWMGHYELATGYSDAKQQFTLQDSYYGPNQVMEYKKFDSYWRAFNFTYIVVFPKERAKEVETILGPNVDEEYNYRYAAQKASNDIYALTGRDQFFAWFNRGTNLVRLQDYAGAAAAYDEAFALYPTIREKERPWRMMWYQTGPYWAYYYTARYQDVIDLATKTLDAMSEPVLEESYYWRALAREALGDSQEANKDLRSSLEYHPGFEPSLTQLEQLGENP